MKNALVAAVMVMIPMTSSKASTTAFLSTTTLKTFTTGKEQSLQKAAPSILDVDQSKEEDDFEQSERLKKEILSEIDSGIRSMPAWFDEKYGDSGSVAEEEEDDDPDAIDPETLGKWDVTDLKDKFEYEWDPEVDADPNELDPNFEHVTEFDVDEDGVEVGYDPIFGRSNPIDSRTKVTSMESYFIDDATRDDAIVTPTFPENDIEIEYNTKIKNFRKSLKIIDTYKDPFLGDDYDVPRNVAKWHGYPEQTKYPSKPFENNRFTKPEDKTDFTKLDPYRAKKTAVQLARSKNNEWLPKGKSEAFHRNQTDIFRKLNLLQGSLRAGEVDEEIVKRIQPALNVLGSVADLLSMHNEGKVFRFHYHGLIKHREGMAAWTETLIRDCGVECTGVVFETGWRKRDPYYDGGDHWFGPY
mmetsp:Transcript_3399/g.5224  ORF Transcript_3399/g.5224 Transcript_3399/m.5224 type:complete len:413 (-) Transcript_3399:588-1826(-)